MKTDIGAREIAQLLAGRIVGLSVCLLPAGHREGAGWRCGSIAGEPGHSFGVHLTGAKAGVWSDFSTGQKGDALALVAAVRGRGIFDAMLWSMHWLGQSDGVFPPPRCRAAPPANRPDISVRWRYPWQAARPIRGTPAEIYLRSRGLHFDDPKGLVLRFAPRRARLNPKGCLQEHHPALLALLREVQTGEPCGIINVFLRPDGRDRLRDKKGKTVTGRAKNAAAMLSSFGEPTYGLTICEGAETGLALLMQDLAPVWCCGGAGNLAAFPVLPAIECLTIAADADEVGQKAAVTVTERWRRAGHEVVIVAPPIGDWADAIA